jgi:predicted type IV restriction endonuclease
VSSAVPPEVERLVDQFAANETRYSRPDYNEFDTRTSFIHPFFVALGWDVNNNGRIASTCVTSSSRLPSTTDDPGMVSE